MHIKVVIVDDEKSGIHVLSKLIEKYVPAAKIIGTFQNAEEALSQIPLLHPDLIFSDIEMAEMSGLDLLSNLPDSMFTTVFVTAHPQYTIEAIRNSAFDYLLKPIRVKELLNVFKRFSNKQQFTPNQHSNTILLHTSSKMFFVPQEEIIMIKGDGSYCTFYLSSGATEVVSKNLAHYERLINAPHFFRVHKSYLVNLKQVINLNMEDGLELALKGNLRATLSASKKNDFLNAMKSI